ncbi:hypothetical protein AVEN_33944-1 [Araneus ventricosus]|uniref:Uncharacterized protein n=1 Tax=Araneus ventricosus TaxID=182803 RepID=A0A4Y2K059_ARAVE|nr:hypothetical protein AVEN_33944-1 [Araneus ventricosus]
MKETYRTLEDMLSSVSTASILIYVGFESDCRLSWIASRLHASFFCFLSASGTVGTEKAHIKKVCGPKRQFLIPGVKNGSEPLKALEKILFASISHQIRFDEFCYKRWTGVDFSSKTMGCNMLKNPFLALSEFYLKTGPVSDEHSERFHQDISNMAARYGGNGIPKC